MGTEGGTLLGSGLTAWTVARTELRRNEALERQQTREEAARDRTQRRELRVEHQKWRRDRRQAAYQSLMDAAHEAQGARWQLGRLTLEPFDQHRHDIRRGAAIDAIRATRRAADAVQSKTGSGSPVATRKPPRVPCTRGVTLLRADRTVGPG